MHTQNTHSPALREVLDHWRVLAKDDDPIVRAAARELLADLTERPRTRTEQDNQQAAPWHNVIGQVINQEPGHRAARGYKTGHGHVHASKSGTCVSVDTALGKWYCSSCRRGGTAVTWVMDIEQCSYGEAWQVLVSRFGVAHG